MRPTLQKQVPRAVPIAIQIVIQTVVQTNTGNYEHNNNEETSHCSEMAYRERNRMLLVIMGPNMD
jgi:hypothetical protein